MAPFCFVAIGFPREPLGISSWQEDPLFFSDVFDIFVHFCVNNRP